MVREVEEPIEVDYDEKDGDDTIGDKCLEKLLYWTLSPNWTSVFCRVR